MRELFHQLDFGERVAFALVIFVIVSLLVGLAIAIVLKMQDWWQQTECVSNKTEGYGESLW